MTVAFPSASPTATTSARMDNNYATLFFAYINRSLAEALATVRAVTAKLPDEERVQACHVLDYGLRMADAWPQARDLTVALAPYVERSGQWENWHQQLQRAIDLAEQIQDIDGKLGLMVFVARLAQRQGRVAETIYYYRRVIRLARQTGNRFEEARACSNLGYLFTETGRFLLADVLCQHALAVFTDLQSNHGLAHTHNHLGLLYTRQKRYVPAEHHLKVACMIWQQMGDTHSLFHGNVNLGILCNQTEQPNEALKHFDSALQSAELSGEAIGIGKIWNNIGLVHLNLRNFSLAEQYFWKAQSLFSQISDYGELAKTHYNLGLTYQHLKKWQDALTHLEMALSIFQDAQNTIEAMKVLVALVGQGINPAHDITSERHLKTLVTLVAQQKKNELLSMFQDFLTEYGNSFPDINIRKLLPLAAM